MFCIFNISFISSCSHKRILLKFFSDYFKHTPDTISLEYILEYVIKKKSYLLMISDAGLLDELKKKKSMIGVSIPGEVAYVRTATDPEPSDSEDDATKTMQAVDNENGNENGEVDFLHVSEEARSRG